MAIQLLLHRFDVEAALVQSGVDDLFVASQPPPRVKKGEVCTYQLVVKSKKGGVSYRLESGPEGMEVSKDGRVIWKAPAYWGQPDPDVLISVTDDGKQECFQSFKISVAE